MRYECPIRYCCTVSRPSDGKDKPNISCRVHFTLQGTTRVEFASFARRKEVPKPVYGMLLLLNATEFPLALGN